MKPYSKSPKTVFRNSTHPRRLLMLGGNALLAVGRLSRSNGAASASASGHRNAQRQPLPVPLFFNYAAPAGIAVTGDAPHRLQLEIEQSFSTAVQHPNGGRVMLFALSRPLPPL